MTNDRAEDSHNSNKRYLRLERPSRPSASQSPLKLNQSRETGAFKQIMKKMSRIREFASESPLQPEKKISTLHPQSDTLPQFSKMVKYLPEEIVIEERKARTDIKSAEKSSINHNRQRLEELRNMYKEKREIRSKLKFKSVNRKKMSMQFRTEPALNENAEQQTYLDIYKKYLDEKPHEDQLQIGTQAALTEGDSRLSHIKLKSGQIQLRIIENLKQSIRQQTDQARQFYRSQYRNKTLKNKGTKLFIKKNSCKNEGRHKSITQLIYQNFCMKYRDYTDIKSEQQKTINQNFSSYRKQRKSILHQMKQEGLSQEKQFRVISEMDKNYQTMSNALKGIKLKKGLSQTRQKGSIGHFLAEERVTANSPIETE